MKLSREDIVILEFSNTNEFSEVNIVKGVFEKLNIMTQKAGFKRDFSPDEIELIRTVNSILKQGSNVSTT